jgi:hypothetical protein
MKNAWFGLTIIFLLSGCASDPSAVSELKSQMELLQRQIIDLQDQVSTSAVVDPTTKSYSAINTRAGTLLVSVDKVEPYLDGFKIYLQIGNPMAVIYNGCELKVKYAKEFNEQDGWDKYEDWKKTVKEKQFQVTNQLLPGQWNNVDIVIASVKPDEMKHLEVFIETNNVVLGVPGD